MQLKAERVRFLLVLTVFAAAFWFGVQWLEREYPQHLPWTPLELDAPVGAGTKPKLRELAGDKAACLALFETSALAVTPIEDREITPHCGYVDAVALETMTAAYAPGTVRLSCPLAAALAIWEQRVVQPSAQRAFDAAVTRIDHFGTYSCRRTYGSAAGRWSKHATAEAIDIAAFHLEDGRQVDIRADWGADSDAGAFLEDIRSRGCDIFGTLLGPDYNAAHRDHFHLQATGFGTCR